MNIDVQNKTGIYIAYPTSSILKSIYKAKNYKTRVNNQHTKVGIAKDSFASRARNYFLNFDNEIEFLPIVEIPVDQLQEAEKIVVTSIATMFDRVGNSRNWFDTSDREQFIFQIRDALLESGFDHVWIGPMHR